MRKFSRRQALQHLSAGTAVSFFPGIAKSQTLDASSRDADVIVVGAGLSGLQAAVLLHDLDVDVLVLEGSQRVGGRVYTRDDAPGRPDVGGSEIGAAYARVRDMIDRVGGQTLKPFKDIFELEFALNIDESLMPVSDWPQSPANKLVGKERNLGPAGPFGLGQFYAQRPNPLTDLDSWLEPESAKWDIGYGDFLKAQGASEEAMRLITKQHHPDTLNGMSALWQLRVQRFQQFAGGIDALEQMTRGMSRLPEGMANILSREVIFGTTIQSFAYDDKGVQLRDTEGNVYRAKYVICALPLTILKTIKFDPGLPALQAEAVANIPSDRSLSVYFHVKEPYWEQDGLPASTWTNMSMGRAFRYTADDGYYLWMLKSGNDAAALRGLSEAEIKSIALQELNAARPSTIGRVEPTIVMNWGDYPWTQGHNAYRGPGQIAKYANVVADPHGRIHFAGEHTSEFMIGMEGAMESGERTAFEVFERLAAYKTTID